MQLICREVVFSAAAGHFLVLGLLDSNLECSCCSVCANVCGVLQNQWSGAVGVAETKRKGACCDDESVSMTVSRIESKQSEIGQIRHAHPDVFSKICLSSTLR